MSRRNSPKDVEQLEDLNRLSEIIKDKRNAKRADAKKNRRNRHYEKQFIKNALTHGLIDKKEDINIG
jgi:DNA-binding protein H-NS